MAVQGGQGGRGPVSAGQGTNCRKHTVCSWSARNSGMEPPRATWVSGQGWWAGAVTGCTQRGQNDTPQQAADTALFSICLMYRLARTHGGLRDDPTNGPSPGGPWVGLSRFFRPFGPLDGLFPSPDESASMCRLHVPSVTNPASHRTGTVTLRGGGCGRGLGARLLGTRLPAWHYVIYTVHGLNVCAHPP